MPTQNTSAILANLQALANKTNGNLAGAIGNPAQGSSSNVSFPQSAFPQQNMPFVNPAASMQPAFQAVGAPTPVNNGVFPYGNGAVPNVFQAGGQQQQMPNMAGMMQQSNAPGMPDTLKQQLEILSALKAQGVPQQDWPGLLTALMATANTPQGANPGAIPAPTNVGSGNIDISRDRNGFDRDRHVRSPQGRRERSRSRSPRGWDRRRENSPHGRRRDSPVYGEYGGNRNGDRGGDFERRGGRGGRGNQYRQRSPQRRRSPSPQRQDQTLPAPGPKWIEYDHSLPKGHIKGTLIIPLAQPYHQNAYYLCSLQQNIVRGRCHVSFSQSVTVISLMQFNVTVVRPTTMSCGLSSRLLGESRRALSMSTSDMLSSR